jgi:hypothetical protein
LKYGLANGESIAGIELKLKDLPQFNRKRARMTAQTEILQRVAEASGKPIISLQQL